MTDQTEQQNGYANGRANGNSQGQANGNASTPRGSNSRHYPLSDHPDQLRAGSGRTLDEISMDAVREGDLAAQDLQIGAETLLAQAEIARQAGFRELAANLTRAAELTAVPNQELLRMYEILRPNRSSFIELMELAHTLEDTYGATVTAEFVREAAQVYQTRNLLRRDRKDANQ